MVFFTQDYVKLKLKPLFEVPAGRKARLALFLSGTGSNAIKILERAAAPACPYEIAVLVTDNPEKSIARTLAEKYSLPLVEHDIRAFYQQHGEETIALTSPRRCELRDKWSDELYEKIKPFQVDAGILAGFIPLSNIVGKLTCLNVHPGDLTVVKNGVRVLAGLHYRPVENAILMGHQGLRSSVIVAQNYQGNGKNEVDSGPILGISAPVKIELDGFSIAELQEISDKRGAPPHKDELRRLADKNVEKLKLEGDHVVFPAVIEHFVRGDYALGDDGLYFKRSDGCFIPVETIEFFPDGSEIPRDMPVLDSKDVSGKKRNFLLRLLKYYYIKVIRTPGTPEFVARGWALGVAVGCIVPVFCQLIVAVPLSFVFRCSKVGAAGGTFVTTPPTAIFIYPVQIWLGNKIINGDLSPDAAVRLVEIFNGDYSFAEKWRAFADMGSDLVAAFFAGGIAWAALMVPLVYFGVKKLVVSYRAMRESRRKKSALAGGKK